MIKRICMLSVFAAICAAVPIQVQQHGQQVYHQTAEHHEHGHQAYQHGHAVSSQSFVSNHQPVQHHHGDSYGYNHGHEEEYPHHHPSYKYEYSVHDDHTYDVKNQSEQRDGDVTHGQYSLLQPDGHMRNVVYHVDKHSGFNAEVTYTGHGHGGARN